MRLRSLASVAAITSVVALASLSFESDAPRLGARPGGVGAEILSPLCDGKVDIVLRNETPRPAAMQFLSDSNEILMPPVEVPAGEENMVVRYSMRKPVEVIKVEVAEGVLSARKVGRPDPCLVENRVSWGNPIIEEEFDGDSLDPKEWAIYNSPNAQQHPRSPQAVKLKDGNLMLSGGIYDINGAPKDVSGGVAHKFGQMHGKWEARIRADKGEGYAPVVLLWPDSEKWPDDGEVDVIEIPATNRQVGASFLHNGPKDNKVQRSQYFDWTLWHTVSVEWLPDRITIAVDGIEQWHVIDPKYIPSTSPMHMTLQNDQGTPFTEKRTPSTPDRVSMYVDWIKVWSLPK